MTFITFKLRFLRANYVMTSEIFVAILWPLSLQLIIRKKKLKHLYLIFVCFNVVQQRVLSLCNVFHYIRIVDYCPYR